MTSRSKWPALALCLSVVSGCLRWSELESGRCGDGVVGPEEQCDDGNRVSKDGCDARCKREPNRCKNSADLQSQMCDAGGATECDGPCEMPNLTLCGNGEQEEGEGCDDGNAAAGDGCDERCQIEPVRPLCGNGTLDSDEVCDDANDVNTDACLNGCSRATCGDGQVRQNVEECDVVGGDDLKTCQSCLRCPAPPNGLSAPDTKHCYTRHTELAPQGAARSVCQEEGGDLWVPTSINEANTVVDRLKLSGKNWIGRVLNGGIDRWVTGESTSFSNYADKEPSVGVCVAVGADGKTNAWSSVTCATPLSFVCERAPARTWLPSNHGYKVRTGTSIADRARTSCRAEGGYLVALETAEEQAFVATLTPLPVWVDAREISAGMFAWPDGQPVAPNSIAMDDRDGSQACVSLEPGGKLIDRTCVDSLAFVCEFD